MNKIAADRPWDLLNQAADLLHACSPFAVPGPWRFYRDEGLTSIDSPVEGLPVCTDASVNGEWIAAMSPAIAPHLEAAFRDAAKHWFDRISEADGHLVQLALAIREAFTTAEKS